MTGAVYIKGIAVTKYKRSAVNEADEWPSKFSKFFIELNDGLELSFTDKRRFAKVRLLDDPASVPPISELGPDALLEPMTEDVFFKALSKKKISIKTLLLDQSFISGIGNWVADEVLYQARIHPLRIASSLSREDSARLLKCIKEVLEKAVEVGADNIQYPSNWIFHSRDKKPGKAFVDGKEIDFINVGGRTTAYVPELQKLSGGQATKAPAKTRKQPSKKKDDEDSDDNDVDAGASNSEEEERGNMKSKRTNNKGGVKKPVRRQKAAKSGGNDDNDNDDDDDKKTAPEKRKSQRIEGNKNANKSNKSGGMAKKARTESRPEENNDSDATDDYR